MVYAIEEMKIAAAGFAACGGTYGKGKREKAVLPPGGQAQGDVYAYADHLCELCHRDRAGHLSAQPACCQQARGGWMYWMPCSPPQALPALLV